MIWSTLYIKGIGDFKEQVLSRLQGLDGVMPGFVQSEHGAELFWVDPALDLRTIKETIGAKLIWKYRLRFHSELQDFMQPPVAA